MTTENQKVTRRWEKPHVKWRFNPEKAPTDIQAIIQQAFDVWKNESESTVSNEFSGTTTKSSPAADSFSDIFFSVDFASLGIPSKVIALTLRNSKKSEEKLTSPKDAIFTEADILVNPRFSSEFVSTPSSDPTSLDLVEVLAHEIGHLYGLAHSFLIDSMMYPAKPDPNSGLPSELVALFRAPKRTLSRDDAAWISGLYPSSSFRAQRGHIEGKVTLQGASYIGAHVIALKLDEEDLQFNFFKSNSSEFLVVKGLQNVSAFSEENGSFIIPGLSPGRYAIVTQHGAQFLLFRLEQVSSFLERFQSSALFPLQFWQNPDCALDLQATTSNFNEARQKATLFTIESGKIVCDLNIEAHVGGSRCAAKASFNEISCGGGGGCMLGTSFSLAEHKGLLLVFLGGLIIIFIALREGKKNKKR